MPPVPGCTHTVHKSWEVALLTQNRTEHTVASGRKLVHTSQPDKIPPDIHFSPFLTIQTCQVTMRGTIVLSNTFRKVCSHRLEGTCFTFTLRSAVGLRLRESNGCHVTHTGQNYIMTYWAYDVYEYYAISLRDM